jgi:hypothetical protein
MPKSVVNSKPCPECNPAGREYGSLQCDACNGGGWVPEWVEKSLSGEEMSKMMPYNLWSTIRERCEHPPRQYANLPNNLVLRGEPDGRVYIFFAAAPEVKRAIAIDTHENGAKRWKLFSNWSANAMAVIEAVCPELLIVESDEVPF